MNTKPNLSKFKVQGFIIFILCGVKLLHLIPNFYKNIFSENW